MNLLQLGQYWALIITSNFCKNRSQLNFEFKAMTVSCQLLLVGDEKQLLLAAEKVKQQTLALEKKYNFYADDSWLNSHINNRDLSQVLVDVQTAQILEQVRALSQTTKGVFDITVGTLKQAAKVNKTLSLSHLYENNHNAIGLESWSLSQRVLTFSHPNTQFDLGGVVKEYAVDQAMMLCRRIGVKAGLINFGGDIITWGNKADGSNFRIALKNPVDATKICASLALNNQALATSGHYERQFLCGSDISSHIISPVTTPDVLSVSVISNSVLKSGIYSTALSVAPQLIQSSQNQVTALFIDRALNIHRDTQILASAL